MKLDFLRQVNPGAALLIALSLALAWPVLPICAADATADAAAIQSAESGAGVPVLLDGDFASAIVIDADTGWVLLEKNIRARREPASMLKMMTELIVLERVADGDVSMEDTVTVSAKASRMGGSQVYLKHGETFTVRELLTALAIQSANDAAVALAEHIAGSTEAFVDLMNLRARELGMNDTVFRTTHGLPAGRGQEPDFTTAYDMAVLGRHLIEYEDAREWASTKTAPFRDGTFIMYNPNKLIGTFRGLDGIKTGYHRPAGFCVTASAVQKGKRLISVVMGSTTNRSRATETSRLLSYGFSLYTSVAMIPAAGQILSEPVKVKGGKQSAITVAYGEALAVSVPKQRAEEVVLDTDVPEQIVAPIEKGDEVGRATAYLDGAPLGSVPIVAVESVEKGNWLDRLFH